MNTEETKAVIDTSIEAFEAIDWVVKGREAAEDLGSDILECWYRLPTSSSTPWGDDTPESALNLTALAEDYGYREDEIEQLVEEAADNFNSGWNEVEGEAHEQAERSRVERLQRLTAEGWRICQFGLPGSNTWVVEIAEPGRADKVSSGIWSPGPHGPYDSAILTPAEADRCKWQDGSKIYAQEIAEIIRRSESAPAESHGEG